MTSSLTTVNGVLELIRGIPSDLPHHPSTVDELLEALQQPIENFHKLTHLLSGPLVMPKGSVRRSIQFVQALHQAKQKYFLQVIQLVSTYLSHQPGAVSPRELEGILRLRALPLYLVAVPMHTTPPGGHLEWIRQPLVDPTPTCVHQLQFVLSPDAEWAQAERRRIGSDDDQQNLDLLNQTGLLVVDPEASHDMNKLRRDADEWARDHRSRFSWVNR